MKQNLKILQIWNDLQESQISELTHYLNLTMIQVWEHHGVLCKVNAKLLVFNNTLVKIMEVLNYLHYMTTLLTDIHTTVTRLTSAVFSLKEGVESLYKYMWVLANHEVNPLIVPPSELWFVLLDIKHNIHLHPWLALPDDPNDNIWAYYPILQVSSIVKESFLIVILLIPLIDKSLQMDLYKVYNLPALHPDLKVQFSYFLEGEYLAILTSHTYATMPTPHDICICLASWGHLCDLNTALYPVNKIEWCVCTFYQKLKPS